MTLLESRPDLLQDLFSNVGLIALIFVVIAAIVDVFALLDFSD